MAILVILDVILWIIFSIIIDNSSAITSIIGILACFLLVIILALIAGYVGAYDVFDEAKRQRKEIDAARMNEYRLRNLYDSITKNNRKK